MTLHEATKICLSHFHDELPERFKWRDEQRRCEKTNFHDARHSCAPIPMPPPSDELAIALQELKKVSVAYSPLTKTWGASATDGPLTYDHRTARDAIIFACASLAERLNGK